MRTAAWKVLSVVTLSLISLSSLSTPSYAAGGYGPGEPGLPGVPGGFERDVRIVKTIGFSGGQLSTTLANKVGIKVVVPPAAFVSLVRVAVTAPPFSELSSMLPKLGLKAYSPVTGLGLFFSNPTNGKSLKGHFAKPVTVTLRGPDLGVPGEKVFELTSATSAKELATALKKGIATFSLRSDPDLLVVNPVNHRGR